MSLFASGRKSKISYIFTIRNLFRRFPNREGVWILKFRCTGVGEVGPGEGRVRGELFLVFFGKFSGATKAPEGLKVGKEPLGKEPVGKECELL